MFENPGSKIRGWAMFVGIIGILASICIGFIIMSGNTYIGYYYGDNIKWIGFLIMLGGSLLSWVAALFIYGFGELVENSSDIRLILASIQKINREQADAFTSLQKSTNEKPQT